MDLPGLELRYVCTANMSGCLHSCEAFGHPAGPAIPTSKQLWIPDGRVSVIRLPCQGSRTRLFFRTFSVARSCVDTYRIHTVRACVLVSGVWCVISAFQLDDTIHDDRLFWSCRLSNVGRLCATAVVSCISPLHGINRIDIHYSNSSEDRFCFCHPVNQLQVYPIL